MTNLKNKISGIRETDDYKRTDQWGSDWLEHDIITARKKCKQCHAATRCADCCFLCDHRCEQYQICEVVKQYAVDAAPYDPSEEQLIDAFKDLQSDRTIGSRISNLNDYTYTPVVKESLTTEEAPTAAVMRQDDASTIKLQGGSKT